MHQGESRCSHCKWRRDFMNLDFLFEDDAERKQHTSIIQGVVKEVGFSEKTILRFIRGF
jgi:hypothetical protein